MVIDSGETQPNAPSKTPLTYFSAHTFNPEETYGFLQNLSGREGELASGLYSHVGMGGPIPPPSKATLFYTPLCSDKERTMRESCLTGRTGKKIGPFLN